MKFLVIILLVFPFPVFAQFDGFDTDDLNGSKLEELSESEETDPEDDYYFQQLREYSRHPLNLNGTVEEMENFPLLDALLVSNLLHYRSVLGDLVDIYELQAVPGFTSDIIGRIMPFVALSDGTVKISSVSERFAKGDHVLTVRPVIIPEIAEGFRRDNLSGFTGGRAALFIRYKYRYRHLLQYGFTGEKDAGEPLVAGKFPFMMDFNSFHFFMRECGWIKSLALGDYTVNLGQGLIHWQSQAFKKSAGVLGIKRQSEVLRPYQSAGEYNFHRGIAVTGNFRQYELTLFTSFRKLNANIDTDESQGPVITSIITSGLNRSAGEVADKYTATLLTTGGSLKRKLGTSHISLNMVRYRYSIPLLKRDQPYNLYSIKGKDWSNVGIDYGVTIRNIHAFGEIAIDHHRKPAVVLGALTSLNPKVDLAMLFRSIDKSYQAVYGNAFTESSAPSNEKGFYAGISFRPSGKYRIDAYADVFSFSWLRYRVDAPSDGAQYLAQVTWKPSRQIELYTRYRLRMKPLNAEGDHPIDFPDQRVQSNWRTQMNYQLSPAVLLRSRTETCFYQSKKDEAPESGFLFYTDVMYKPMEHPWSANFRIQYFESAGYDTRIYAYENDLLYVGSTPSFFDTGIRCYVNFRAKCRLRCFRKWILNFSFKAASTFYYDKNEIGSGLSTIHGNRRTELKMQVLVSPAA